MAKLVRLTRPLHPTHDIYVPDEINWELMRKIIDFTAKMKAKGWTMDVIVLEEEGEA